MEQYVANLLRQKNYIIQTRIEVNDYYMPKNVSKRLQ
jgi:hypothetical protein